MAKHKPHRLLKKNKPVKPSNNSRYSINSKPKQTQARPNHNLDRIYGKHSVRAVFQTRPESIKKMLLLSGKMEPPEEFVEMAQEFGIPLEILNWEAFNHAGFFEEDEKHQGICIYTKPRRIYIEDELSLLEDCRCVLALDQISNPQNLGTMLRNAAFFGVDALLMLRNRSADVTSTAVRVAVGGAEFVKIFKVTNLARSLAKLKEVGFWVYGLDERGEKTLAETDFSEKIVFVVGAEGEGLRLRTRKFCDHLARIPGGRKGLESLNAGVATAIALGEFFRE